MDETIKQNDWNTRKDTKQCIPKQRQTLDTHTHTHTHTHARTHARTHSERGVHKQLINNNRTILDLSITNGIVDGRLRMGLLPPLGSFADIICLIEN